MAGVPRCADRYSRYALLSAPQDRRRWEDRKRALRADAIEAVTCGWLSLIVVVSLAAQMANRGMVD